MVLDDDRAENYIFEHLENVSYGNEFIKMQFRLQHIGRQIPKIKKTVCTVIKFCAQDISQP